MAREPFEPGARPAVDETRRTPRWRAARVEQTNEQYVIEGVRGARVFLNRVVVGGRRVRRGGGRQCVSGGDERAHEFRERAELDAGELVAQSGRGREPGLDARRIDRQWPAIPSHENELVHPPREEHGLREY